MNLETWNALMDDAQEGQNDDGFEIIIYMVSGAHFRGHWTFAEGYLEGIILATALGPVYLDLASIVGFMVPVK